jgi:hypothetical protein
VGERGVAATEAVAPDKDAILDADMALDVDTMVLDITVACSLLSVLNTVVLDASTPLNDGITLGAGIPLVVGIVDSDRDAVGVASWYRVM